MKKEVKLRIGWNKPNTNDIEVAEYNGGAGFIRSHVKKGKNNR